MTQLTQLIYASQPFGYDEPTLAGILLDARRCNIRDGITGALVCRHDVYLQLLEGPEAAVAAAFIRIGYDDRHAGVKTLASRSVSERMFGKWAMLHDPAQTCIWSAEEISAGALDRATPDVVLAMFAALAKAPPTA